MELMIQCTMLRMRKAAARMVLIDGMANVLDMVKARV
jgi:hypothetical protein